MKRILFYLVVVFVFAQSCTDCPCDKQLPTDRSPVSEISKGFYINGKVIIPATSTNPVGIIRVYVNEESQEFRPLKGIIYKFNDGPVTNKALSGYEEVFFKVIKKDDVMYAIDILRKSEKPEIQHLWKMQTDYTSFDKYSMELHVEDKPNQFHNKIHIRGVVRVVGGGELTVLEISDDTPSGTPSGDYREIIVRTNLVPDESFWSDSVFSLNLLDRTIDNNPIYHPTTDHTHIFK